jgi:aspartate-semialdehyde dehydrogenase
MALSPLQRAFGLKSVVVTTFQAVSGGGREACAELAAQRCALISGRPLEASFYPAPIADNVIAQCESIEADGYTSEELKLLVETRKILDLPSLPVAMTAVRVPVTVGHSAAVLVETEAEPSIDEARQALADFPGVRWVSNPQGPTPLDVAHCDDVLVGRLRRDLTTRRLWLWEVSNNLRKGAATNAIQIAEALPTHAPTVPSKLLVS